MTDNQPEALRLANWLSMGPLWQHKHSAAALRRLHAENAELLEALKAVTAHLDRIGTHTEDYVVIVAAEKLIKKIEGARND